MGPKRGSCSAAVRASASLARTLPDRYAAAVTSDAARRGRRRRARRGGRGPSAGRRRGGGRSSARSGRPWVSKQMASASSGASAPRRGWRGATTRRVKTDALVAVAGVGVEVLQGEHGVQVGVAAEAAHAGRELCGGALRRWPGRRGRCGRVLNRLSGPYRRDVVVVASVEALAGEFEGGVVPACRPGCRTARRGCRAARSGPAAPPPRWPGSARTVRVGRRRSGRTRRR